MKGGSPDDKVCVIPVRAADAEAWAKGLLHDRDLLLESPLVPEAIFIVNLPNRAAYFECVRLLQYWSEKGAVCVITRTGNQVVADHIRKYGAVAGLVELSKPPMTRYLVPPAGLAKWLARLKAGHDGRMLQKAAASALVTSAR